MLSTMKCKYSSKEQVVHMMGLDYITELSPQWDLKWEDEANGMFDWISSQRVFGQRQI